MTTREKTLAGLAGGVLALIIGYLFLDRLVLKAAADLDRQGNNLRHEINQKTIQNRQRGHHEKQLAAFAARTFDADEMRASEAVRGHLNALLHRSGLGSSELSLKPFNGPAEAGAYREIGWFVRARGKLDHVVNFLFLVSEDPYLHRMESLILSPVPRSLDVDVQARYSTLVLKLPAGPDGGPFKVNQVQEALGRVQLDGPARQRYDVIAARDVLRPYVKRQERPVAPPPPPVERPRTVAEAPAAAPSAPPPPRPPAWARMRVVGLPSWGDTQDIFLRDSTTSEVRRFQPGDQLAGGKVVMVDYRPMPMPDRPEVLSGSRIIIRIGPEHWVVELGQTLADKRIMRQGDLPAGLEVEPPAPAPGPEAPPPAAPATEVPSPAAPPTAPDGPTGG
jgi:hypothetical protein